ncbi:MAG: internalization-related competence protein ComEC/Rec2 [Paenibacillus sp.]|nr:internalization-related competence protein ComEC/Rec2 [Paenibacillus sp.]
MLRAMNRRPLVWFAASWVGGSAAAAGLGLRGAMLAGGAAALLAVAASAGRLATGRLAALCLLAFCLAAGQRLWADERNATSLTPLLAAAEAAEPGAAFVAAASGTIVSAVEVDGDRAMFRMKADAVHAGGIAQPVGAGELLQVQLRLVAQPEQEIAAAWQRGDRIDVAGELTRPAEATNSGGFDYRRYLSSQRIHWLLRSKGAASVTVVPEATWNAAALLGRIDAARAGLGARLAELYPAHQSGYMQGLILGLREGLDPDTFNEFAKLGLTHILAISGLHVAVFMVMLGGLLKLLRISRERSQLSLMAAIPFYVLLTGASPSVLRAGIMAILGLIAARLGKLKDGMHLLAAAAVAILAYDPYFLDSVSFQLSFAVTFGLICGVPPLRRLLPRIRGFGWLCDLVAVTVAAQLVSFPLTIYYFNQFHLLSLAANLVLVPFISFVVMPIGTAALLLSPLWFWGAKKLADLSAIGNDWTFRLVEKLATAGSLRLIWETPPLWWVAAYLSVLFLLFRQLYARIPADFQEAITERTPQDDDPTAPLTTPHTRPMGQEDNYGHGARLGKSRRFFYSAALLVVLIAYAYYPDPFDRAATVSFLDVGQGDSALIRTPTGRHILVDGGGTITYRKPGEEWKERSDPFEVGKKVVVPLLMKRGVKQIDALVITHLDSDHIRGLAAVVEAIPVRAVWWNGTMKESEDAESLMSLLIEADIPLYALQAGDAAEIDVSAKVSVFWPPRSGQAGVPIIDEQNESSLVFTLDLYDRRFLFTGDIGTRTEEAILTAIEEKTNLKTVDVMKVAHHGSRYSTGEPWLHVWKPTAAVISVGQYNTYGHPHPDVLRRTSGSGAAVWRTDLTGEAAFRITPRGLSYWMK